MDCRYALVESRACRVVVGDGVGAGLPELLSPLRADRVIVLHDAAIPRLAEDLAIRLDAVACLPIDPTPPVKHLATIERLAGELHELGATRATALIGVGGGTTTDVVGFLASIWLRGVPCVFCPTTTLAMCDAALGGKNGIDHQGLKNRLGTIRQPDLIVMDVAWLRDLPDALFAEGLVEVVKKAAVLDADHFAELERRGQALRTRDPAGIVRAVEMAVQMKMRVVLEDEREVGARQVLNFGHTIGHAVESLAQGRLRHGQAVAIGMIAECRAAGVDETIVDRIQRLLRAIDAPTRVPHEFADRHRLWQLAQRDKKAMRGSVPMLVPTAIGRHAAVELTEESLARALA